MQFAIVFALWQVVRFLSVLFHALPWKETPQIKKKCDKIAFNAKYGHYGNTFFKHVSI